MSHVIFRVPVALLFEEGTNLVITKRIRMAENCEVGRESSVQYGGSDVYWARRK